MGPSRHLSRNGPQKPPCTLKALVQARPSSVPRSGLKMVLLSAAIMACSSSTIEGLALDISSCSVGSVTARRWVAEVGVCGEGASASACASASERSRDLRSRAQRALTDVEEAALGAAVDAVRWPARGVREDRARPKRCIAARGGERARGGLGAVSENPRTPDMLRFCCAGPRSISSSSSAGARTVADLAHEELVAVRAHDARDYCVAGLVRVVTRAKQDVGARARWRGARDERPHVQAVDRGQARLFCHGIVRRNSREPAKSRKPVCDLDEAFLDGAAARRWDEAARCESVYPHAALPVAGLPAEERELRVWGSGR